jgi:hypothetical protein
MLYLKSIESIGESMKMHGQSVDFAAISKSNPAHAKAWHLGMDTARIELDRQTLKKEFVRWAIDHSIENADHFASLADWRFVTIGRIAWLMNNGAEIPEESMVFLLKQISILHNTTADVTEAVNDQDEHRTITADGKKVLLYVNLYSYIDAVRTKFAEDQERLEEMIRKRIQDAEPGMPMLRKLYQHYREMLNDAIEGRDNELVAATVEPLVIVVNVLASITGNASAMSASKRKVSNKIMKATSKAKVKNLDADTNIVGLSPALLVGNTSALLYNTKNRKAMYYVASEGNELNIKGTYITGYDEKASFGKTLRKPKETFSKILHNANPKRIAEVLGKYINGKQHELNGKLNKDIIIIKVFR